MCLFLHFCKETANIKTKKYRNKNKKIKKIAYFYKNVANKHIAVCLFLLSLHK